MKAREIMLMLAGCVTLLPGSLTANETPAPAEVCMPTTNSDERNQRMQWWREARLGMFVHYGLYSGLAGVYKGKRAGGEWIQCNVGADTDSYAAEALPLFNPAEGCVEKWVDLAKEAGCRYAVFTSKHHEGFALFNTAVSDYNSVKVAGRDIAREFADACRSRGLRVGFYHSVIDWHHPDYDNTICPDLCYPKGQALMLRDKGIPRNQDSFCRYLHSQVRELMTQYGPVDVMWWDYSQGAAEGDRAWKATELVKMCREINPGVIMNNRLFNAYSLEGQKPEEFGSDSVRGDFYTPEKCVPPGQDAVHDWETCLTVGHHWGYSINDGKFKSPAQVIMTLQECVSKGGNLLLNIGPRADGSIPEHTVNVFRSLGEWMKVNSESVYGSKPVVDDRVPKDVWMTVVKDDFYIFLPEMEEEETTDGTVARDVAPASDSAPTEECSSEEAAEEPALEYYVLRFPGSLFDDVSPQILGQPDCRVEMRRVELPGKDEPQAYLELRVPYSAWDDAVEGLPVLKLSCN